MTAEYTIKMDAPTLETANDAQHPLLENAQKALGFVPEMYRHMAKAPGLLSTYMHGYEQFREHSGFEPAEQEVVFLTISRANGCGYCMGAHSMLADQVSNVPPEVLEALREDKPIPDEKLAALSRFTRSMFDTRGNPSEADVRAFLDAGYEENHILQIVVALAVKTLSNYSNHLNKPELDDAFSNYAWKG